MSFNNLFNKHIKFQRILRIQELLDNNNIKQALKRIKKWNLKKFNFNFDFDFKNIDINKETNSI